METNEQNSQIGNGANYAYNIDYSFNEQDTGVLWVNGANIYQKTFSFSDYLLLGAHKIIIEHMPDVVSVIDLKLHNFSVDMDPDGRITAGDSYVAYSNISSSTLDIDFFCVFYGEYLSIRYNNNWMEGTAQGFITIWYTKF